MRLAVTLLVLILAGCGTAVPSGTPVPTPTPAPSPSPTSTPRLSAPSVSVQVDPTLLEHLPVQVDGLDVMRSPEFDGLAAADPAVVAYGESVITAIVADQATGELATVMLVRFRPDVFDEGRFRDWRDSFDEGVCERAGGVLRNAEATIGGHTTHIGTCAQGVRTYHVWLGNSRVLVSVSAIGEGRLGQRLVEELKD